MIVRGKSPGIRIGHAGLDAGETYGGFARAGLCCDPKLTQG
jgi:hypothetical protein